MPAEKIKQLVVDTSAFIKNEQLQNVAENMFTVQGVMDEIKNDKQLSRLAVLPYNLKVREPFPENLKFVQEFAKKTGDYATLSLTDLTVMALTYELEKQENGTDHLRTEPIMAKTVFSSSKPNPEGYESKFTLPGFYVAKDDGNEGEKSDEPEKEMTEEELAERIAQLSCEPEGNEESLLVKVEEEKEENEDEGVEDDVEEEENEEEEEEDDDEEGWITPSNIRSLKTNFGPQTYSEAVPNVACMTSDFAMQNVLKQIGLKVAALDGRVIKHTRTFILRCYTCFTTTSDVTKIFCRRCGNKTLKRVSVSIDANGKQVIHINTRKPLTAKFKNQTIPPPKGGKHACNPILFEDQPLPQQRLSKKALMKTNALDDDYIAGYSPFVLRDTDSRSAMLRNTNNIKQWMKNYDYDNHRRGYKKK
ncbi:RNA-binding protein NOB1 [Culicoides brevitarsis]|uniref:RNA-binding protein NOB1 n=1 Tax=Culicoides brevitarsis TaxID=469753 RepID=UPI00307B9512